MIDLTHDRIRNKIRKGIDFTKENPTTSYAESHKHLIELYMDYLLQKYPADKKEEE